MEGNNHTEFELRWLVADPAVYGMMSGQVELVKHWHHRGPHDSMGPAGPSIQAPCGSALAHQPQQLRQQHEVPRHGQQRVGAHVSLGSVEPAPPSRLRESMMAAPLIWNELAAARAHAARQKELPRRAQSA